jgi:hypothetical protein
VFSYTPSIHTLTTSKGKLTMDHLLNLLAVHHSRTLRDLKKERPDQAHLLASKHNPGESVTAQKQATGIQNQKNTEQNAHYLLTIMTMRVAFAPFSKKVIEWSSP